MPVVISLWPAGGIASHIARWDGSSWSDVGTGLNGVVRALETGLGRVFVGGDFTAAGVLTANHVAMWNGTTWSPLGSGVAGLFPTVHAMAVRPNGDVFIGGDFSGAGVGLTSNIAKWDGVDWWPLDEGLDDAVYALDSDLDRVLAGGNFRNAGDIKSNGIAVWYETPTGVVGERAPRVSRISAFPNPFNHTTTLSVLADRPGPVALSIFDVAGRKVWKRETYTGSPGPFRVTWGGLDERGEQVATGLYFLRVSYNGRSEVVKLVVVR